LKEFLYDIIKQAGSISLDFRTRLSSLEITKKTDKDLVSAADLAVEAFLVKQIGIRFPDHAILGEECGACGDSEYRWIIDPIDGTTSFVHGQPFYSISIALEKQGQIVMGAVNAPVLEELFFAQRGQGAVCNDKPIGVSQRDKIVDSVLGTGFACLRADLEHNNLPYFNAVAPHTRGIRRYGSVAIDLSYVACARMDGFWELALHSYDIAAGQLILEEAGGRVTDFAGTAQGVPAEVVGTNGLIHEPLLALLAEAQ
jgi:myo-inositol-1(or 4)-monophosphatase